MKGIFWILCFLIFSKACTPTSELPELNVFVAASLSAVLEDLAAAYEQKQGTQITFNTASSGTLARQIEQGAAADLFISANQQWVSYLKSKNRIKDEKKLPIRNRLVLITPTSSSLLPITLSEIYKLPESSRLAMGNPNHVPVGQYAIQAIEQLQWQVSPQQTLQTKDARAALAAVELGEVDLGIVYKTDAEKSKKVKIIGSIPSEAHDSIDYFSGICNNDILARDFLKFLSAPEALKIWEMHGFTPNL